MTIINDDIIEIKVLIYRAINKVLSPKTERFTKITTYTIPRALKKFAYKVSPTFTPVKVTIVTIQHRIILKEECILLIP